MNPRIRKASISDNQIILEFIKELAAYEQLSDKVIATIDDINTTISVIIQSRSINSRG